LLANPRKKKLKFVQPINEMPSPSRNKRRVTYFSRQNYRQSQRQRDHSVIISNM